MIMKPSFHEWAADRRLKGLVLLVLALVAVALVGYTYYTWKSSKYIYSGPTTISVRGEGKVNRVPNVATFSFSVMADAEKPEDAQKQSADAVNKIYEYLKDNGVAEEDIKTLNYNLYPRYRDFTTPAPMMNPLESGAPSMEMMPPDYDYNKDRIAGYTADQTIEVKVRDTSKSGTLIAGVGERGATNVSGLTFTVDDDTAAKAEARVKAIADAREKARQLADALGVRLGRLQGFWEDEGGYPTPMYEGAAMMDSKGMAPAIPVGQNIISSGVNLTYEIW